MEKEPGFKRGDLVINNNRPCPEEIYEVIDGRTITRSSDGDNDWYYDLQNIFSGEYVSLCSEYILRTVKAAEVAEFRKKYPDKLR